MHAEQEQHFSDLFRDACSLAAATPAHKWHTDTSMTTAASSAWNTVYAHKWHIDTSMTTAASSV